MDKRVIVGVVLVLVVGFIGINALNPPKDQENGNQSTGNGETGIENPPSEETGETEKSEPETTESEVITCYEIPFAPDRESNLPRLEVVVGEAVTVDPFEVMGLASEPVLSWVQVFPGMADTWYASHHVLDLEENENGSATVAASEPGVYRLRVTLSDAEYLLEVYATEEIGHKWNVKGVIFGDVWGELGAPEFNIAPDDPKCRELVFSYTMGGPARIGANYVGVVPAMFYKQVLPAPVFGDEGNFLSLTDEGYYGDLVDAAHMHGLQVVHTEQLAQHWDLSVEEVEALETVWGDLMWVDAWFTAWGEYVVPRAEMAERHGVEMFVLYLFPDCDTFKAESYVEEWRDIIAEVREVYSGDIAFNVINADDRLVPLIDDLDAVLITVFPGLYTSRLQDAYNPTVDEVYEITSGMFSAPKESIGGKIPVYYVVAIQSADGQMASEDPEWKLSEEGVDFDEQVIYYEGVFKALENETWVNGFFTERWDYFDQYRREGDSYEAAYFDFTREASTRSKPAEDLIKLWYALH